MDKKNILIVDDHPMIISTYKKIIKKKYKETFETNFCNSYDEALDCLAKKLFEVILIDFELYSSNQKNNLTLNLFLQMIKKSDPGLKIIIIVPENNFLMFSLLRTSYNALLIKKDIKKDVFLDAFNAVLTNQKFSSSTALKLEGIVKKQSVDLDELDLKILFNLSMGISTKNLIHEVPLSLSAIEKRKNRIKTLLNADSDEILLKNARISGLI